MTLAAIGQRLREAIEDRIAPLDITLRHLGALGHLVHRPELSYSDLARRAQVTSQSMRATIAQLAELGAVSIEAPGQGRSAALRVTPAGHELLEEARARITDLDAALTEGTVLDAEALRAFVGVAMQVATQLREIQTDGADPL